MILIVAVQVYKPLSDVFSVENMKSSELVFIRDSIVIELGATIFRSGNITRPSITLAEHSSVYSSPAIESPDDDILTLGGGRAREYTIIHYNYITVLVNIPVTVMVSTELWPRLLTVIY